MGCYNGGGGVDPPTPCPHELYGGLKSNSPPGGGLGTPGSPRGTHGVPWGTLGYLGVTRGVEGFSFLGVFFEPLDFSKNDTPSTRKPCFLRSGGSQNGAKMGPKMEPKSSSGAGGLRESLRERFGRLLEAQEAPQRLPRASQESPRSVAEGSK